MVSYVKTTTDKLGAPYQTVETFQDNPEGWDILNYTIDYGIDGSVDGQHVTSYLHDESGRLVKTSLTSDPNGDGYVDYAETQDLYYNPDGTLARDEHISFDNNGDGLPDFKTVEYHSYDAALRPTVNEKFTFFDDVQSSLDYRKEVMTYTPDGHLDTVTVDDYAVLDFVVARDYDYDALGRIVEEKQMDPFVWGDELFHTVKIWERDDANNKVIFTNLEQFGEKSHVSTFTYKNGYVGELKEYADDAGNTYQRDFVETWSNKYGEPTRVLTSHDANLDGSFTPGSKSGYMDTRDIERFEYGADLDGDGHKDLTSHTIDLGNDKVVIDYDLHIDVGLLA